LNGLCVLERSLQFRQLLFLFRLRYGFVDFERRDLLLDLIEGLVNFLVCGSMPNMIIEIFIDAPSYSARSRKAVLLGNSRGQRLWAWPGTSAK
jgi:hypothetical protein